MIGETIQDGALGRQHASDIRNNRSSSCQAHSHLPSSSYHCYHCPLASTGTKS